MTTQHQQPTIPRFARHLQLRLEFLGLKIHQNYVEFRTPFSRNGSRLELTYGSHNQTGERHVLHMQVFNNNGTPESKNAIFTEFDAAFKYALSAIPSDNFAARTSSGQAMQEHITRMKKLAPLKKIVTIRAEKMSNEFVDKTDFYLLDRLDEVIGSEYYPKISSSAGTAENYTIWIDPNVLGKYKIYIRMIAPNELQVSVADPKNTKYVSGKGNVILGSKNHKNAIFNTLLAEPKDVLSYIQEIISTAEKAKKMGVKAPKTV